MSSENASESKAEVTPEKNELSTSESVKPKKERKPFEWTAKRKEAFEKMRAGLELKNEIALKLKAEKQKSEKEEIKKRVRAIMNGKKAKDEASSESESEQSDSSMELKKKHKKEKAEKPKKRSSSKEKKSRKAEREIKESEDEEEDDSEESDSASDKYIRSQKSVAKAQKHRVNTGKTQRTSTHFLPQDRFIYL